MSVLPGTNLMKLTESLPPEHLTIFEPLANAVNWVELADIGKGGRVVVQGPGHVGLMCVVAARIAGAGAIMVTGTSADALRLEAARTAGAQHTINVDEEDMVARVRDLTRGFGADAVIMCAPLSTEAVAQALDAVRFGGTVVLAGLGDMAPVEVVTDKIVLNSLTVKGGSGSSESSMKTAVAYLNEGRVPTEALLGEVRSLDDFAEAMALLKREHPTKEAIRVTVRHHAA
jgi:threonine dehydrogenase-like Zn-dependent dehydrogenase